MTKHLLIIFASASIFTSCATTGPASFGEVVESNKYLYTEHQRVTGSVEADCFDVMCSIPEQNLKALTDIITKLNDENEARAKAHNKLVDALNHTEYASQAKDKAIADLKAQQNISTAMKWLERIGFLFGVYVFGNL